MAVVRLSGPRAFEALAALAPDLGKPKPRHAHRARLVDPASGAPLDNGLALAFPGPASFTGEDVVELHVHGGPAVLAGLFRALGALGLSPAGRGAFTRRAFANGKMDLSEAEGLADLIDADSDSQRLQALMQMGGAWAARIAGWQARLLDDLAWLEASIDFSDEDDVPVDVAARGFPGLRAVAAEIAALLADRRAGEIIRDGLRVAIVGAPNVGKSTLLNALAGREAAIVSDIPGTTRDVVEVRLDVEGYVVHLADTAGIRETEDAIEGEGVRRARARAEESDLRIFVVDGAGGADRVGFEMDSLWRDGDLVFANKLDLGAGDLSDLERRGGVVRGSALRRDGLDGLLEALSRVVTARAGDADSVLITRERHREALIPALNALERAVAAPPDLAAEDVRLALRSLARIVGRFDVEQVLDRIFGAFCIGK